MAHRTHMMWPLILSPTSLLISPPVNPRPHPPGILAAPQAPCGFVLAAPSSWNAFTPAGVQYVTCSLPLSPPLLPGHPLNRASMPTLWKPAPPPPLLSLPALFLTIPVTTFFFFLVYRLSWYYHMKAGTYLFMSLLPAHGRHSVIFWANE